MLKYNWTCLLNLFMPEYHQTHPTTKKGTDFLSLHLFRHLAGLTDPGIKYKAGKEKFSVHRRQQLSQVTEKQEGMQAEPARDGAACSSPENTSPLSHGEEGAHHEQDSKSTQPLQSLAQPAAFKISKCNFTQGLKFCFPIWFCLVWGCHQWSSHCSQESWLIWDIGCN